MESNDLSDGERFFQEERTAVFRKEEFVYIHTGIVDEEGETWTTTELDEANLFQVYNQYRVRHGIPFPDEIAGLRKHYGISAAKMAQILGFGINQYRMYEDGEVPCISNARTIIAAKEKSVFLSFIEAARADMAESEYNRIRSKAECADGDFVMADRPSVYSGYRARSSEKITAVGQLLISRIGPVFVTKMNKLMFYADFIHYKRHGYGITGLSYRAMQYGPVPESWGMVYETMLGISMEEFVYPGGQSGVQLHIHSDVDYSALTEAEISTIDTVCKLFADMNAGEISEASHKEKAWIANRQACSKISYQEAFALNYN